MKIILTTTAAAVACLLILVAITGCETQSASTTINITPAAATVRKGESVTFTASGGYDYQWTLADYTLGRLSNNRGTSVTYTGIYDSGGSNTVQQTLTAQSFIDGYAGASSNSAGSMGSAVARISQL